MIKMMTLSPNEAVHQGFGDGVTKTPLDKESEIIEEHYA